VRGILVVVGEDGLRNLACGRSMREGSRAECGIAMLREIRERNARAR